VLVLTGIWNITAVHPTWHGTYGVTLMVKIAVVALSRFSAWAHATSHFAWLGLTSDLAGRGVGLARDEVVGQRLWSRTQHRPSAGSSLASRDVTPRPSSMPWR
jgi:hypothetical protein